MRIAIAMLWHEGNSFSPVPTDLDSFRAGGWITGDEARALYAGTASEMGGVIDHLDANPDCDGHFLRLAWAGPAGPVPHETYTAICDEIIGGLDGHSWDAVYLALHGALVTDQEPLADLRFLERVRAWIGPDVKLGVSFDLHANMDPRIAGLVDFATAYRTHPHVDLRMTSRRVLDMLTRCVRGDLSPVGYIAKLSAILPSINMRTTGGPMGEMEVIARTRETGGVIDVSVFGGFSYGDTPAAGAGVMVFADRDPALARATAEAMRDEMEARRDRFYIGLPTPGQALRRALSEKRFPVAVTDPADNPDFGRHWRHARPPAGSGRGAAGRSRRLRLLSRSQPCPPRDRVSASAAC